MTGLGNKYASYRFKEQKKPGVYVGLDGTDFSAVNNAFGHEVGDAAIKTYGGAVRSALDEAAPGVGKAFRAGGDEMMVHLPSHEHAARFARALHQHLDAVPPIQGVHKLSAGMGIGLDPQRADQALYAAKEQKYLPGQEHLPARERKRAFPVGQAPNMAHSLVPGHEGPIPLNDAHAAGVQHLLTAPAPAPTSRPASSQPKSQAHEIGLH
jgi:GGDEF domain-containing protein